MWCPWGYYKQVYGAGSDQVSIIWYSCQQMIGTMTFPRAPIVITMKYLPKPQKEQWGLYADVHAGRGATVILPLSFWFKKNSCAHKAICLFTFFTFSPFQQCTIMSGGASLSEQLEVLLISSNDWFQAFIAAQRDTFVADLQSLGFQEPPFAAQRHGPSTRNQRRARNRLLVIGWVFGAHNELIWHP